MKRGPKAPKEQKEPPSPLQELEGRPRSPPNFYYTNIKKGNS